MTCKNEFLPEVNCEEENTHNIEIIGDSKCPCCGHFTIPNKGDAIAFICPVCMFICLARVDIALNKVPVSICK